MMVSSFRTKLLLAMMLLVVGATGPVLIITQEQVRDSYQQHFQQSFKLQIDSFFQQREARLSPVRDRLLAIASRTRLVAAMENVNHPGATQDDVDDIYKNGLDQLLEVLETFQSKDNPQEKGFFFFVDSMGQVLQPGAAVDLPFQLSGLQQIARQLETISRAVIRNNSQQVGYLALPAEPGSLQLCEMVFTPIADSVTGGKLGVLAAGFPMLKKMRDAAAAGNARDLEAPARSPLPDSSVSAGPMMLTGIWLEGEFYSSSIQGEYLPSLSSRIGQELAGRRQRSISFGISFSAENYDVYCQALRAGSAFPAAYQVCLYSLAEAQAKKELIGRRITILAAAALAGALVLSLLISRGMTGPLRALAAGASQIQKGQYDVKLPVRRPDEVGRLTQAFNEMAEDIKASYLAQEERIRERTRELAERKRAEEALRASEASLREAQRIARLGNWRWEIPANTLRWSEETCSIFGVPRDHQTPLTFEFFLARVHEEDREKVQAAVRQALETGRAFNVEHRVVQPGGEVRIVQERAEALRDGSAKTVALVGTVQDVTEQKRIEAEFLRAQRLDSIGALASGIAHDLNNALSPILMGIQLVRRQVQDQEAIQMLSVMESNTYRGADMVRQVLTFARGRDGERELLNIGRLIREMETIARQTLPKSIRIAAMVPPDLWAVRGNATQIHQVLLNLCINSRDAMPNGGEITLAADNVELDPEEARGIPKATPGAYVLLLVSDTGTGIAPEMLPRIFEPFFTTKGPGKGTGLGLSTIARIVQSHGGFANVRSELGIGTTFEVYLPRADGPPEARPLLPLSSVASLHGSGELVLFVDDDRSVREIVAPALAEHGFRVLMAANGAEALTLFQAHENEVRVLLTDLAMPVMDGAATLKALRLRRPDLPVILMTGELETINPNPPEGVSAFLAKPFRLEQLLNAITNVLRPSRPNAGADPGGVTSRP